MSKIKLTYELDMYEDSELFETLTKATATKAGIDDFYQWIRSNTKHGTPSSLWPEDQEAPFNEEVASYFLELCRDKLVELLGDAKG